LIPESVVPSFSFSFPLAAWDLGDTHAPGYQHPVPSLSHLCLSHSPNEAHSLLASSSANIFSHKCQTAEWYKQRIWRQKDLDSKFARAVVSTRRGNIYVCTNICAYLAT
jgi:hypothetical protein